MIETAKSYVPFTGVSGVYVSRTLEPKSEAALVEFVQNWELCDLQTQDVSELHCTIVHSADAIPEEANSFNVNERPCAARVSAFEWWPGHNNKGYLVATLQSKALEDLNRLWLVRGCRPTRFNEYRPHITITSGIDNSKDLMTKLETVNAYLQDCPLVVRLHNEVVEDVASMRAIEHAMVEQAGNNLTSVAEIISGLKKIVPLKKKDKNTYETTGLTSAESIYKSGDILRFLRKQGFKESNDGLHLFSNVMSKDNLQISWGSPNDLGYDIRIVFRR